MEAETANVSRCFPTIAAWMTRLMREVS
jgi:hypothetical protein